MKSALIYPEKCGINAMIVSLSAKEKTSAMKRFRIKDYGPLLMVLGCAAVFGALLAFGVIDLNTLPELVRERPALALAAILALFVVKGFSGVIVYNPLIIAVSLIFPLPAALAINGVGTAVTLSISYLIGQRTKTQSLDELLDKHPKIRKYFNATRRYGFVSCFAIHTIGLSMEVLGILFGMLRIGFWRYLISSWLAIVPGMICFTIVGSELQVRSPLFWAVLAADAVMIAFGVVYTRKKVLSDPAPDAAQAKPPDSEQSGNA